MESLVLISMFSPSLVFLVNLDGSERERERERERGVWRVGRDRNWKRRRVRDVWREKIEGKQMWGETGERYLEREDRGRRGLWRVRKKGRERCCNREKIQRYLERR